MTKWENFSSNSHRSIPCIGMNKIANGRNIQCESNKKSEKSKRKRIKKNWSQKAEIEIAMIFWAGYLSIIDSNY